MALDPEKATGIPRRLISIYNATELTLLNTLANAITRGIASDDWQARQPAEAAQLKAAADRLSRGLAAATPGLITQAATDAVTFGRNAADEDINLAGHLTQKSGRPAGLTTTLTVGEQRLARKAATDGINTLTTITQQIPNATTNLYQQVTARVNATSASTEATRRQAAQQALNVLTARGITGFKDNAGRNWALSTYVEMKSRTLVNNTLMQAHIDTMLDRGLDLVVVSSHPNPAPQCQPFEGQILSIGDAPAGTTVRPNATGGAPVRVKVKATMDQARARGFRHPNCRHTVAAYIPGASRTFTTQPNDAGYKATQKQRAMERAIRDTKRRQATTIDPTAKKRLNGTLRSQQESLKQHIAANDLKRRTLRERPDYGYHVDPPTGLDTAPTVTPVIPKPTPAPARATATARLEPEYGPGIRAFDRQSLERLTAAVPPKAQAALRRAGVKVVIANDYRDTTIGQTYEGKFTADGRPLSDTTFYDPTTNTVLVRTRTEGGSVNPIAHELGHALDLTYLKQQPRQVDWHTPNRPPRTQVVREFADDPYLQYAHTLVTASKTGDTYYKTGSAGDIKSGLREWIAESYAALVMGNEKELLSIAGGRVEAVDIMRWAMTNYGVLE